MNSKGSHIFNHSELDSNPITSELVNAIKFKTLANCGIAFVRTTRLKSNNFWTRKCDKVQDSYQHVMRATHSHLLHKVAKDNSYICDCLTQSKYQTHDSTHFTLHKDKARIGQRKTKPLPYHLQHIMWWRPIIKKKKLYSSSSIYLYSTKVDMNVSFSL